MAVAKLDPAKKPQFERELARLFERRDDKSKPGERVIISRPLGTVNVGIRAFKKSVAHLPKGVKSKLISEYKQYAWKRVEDQLDGLRGQGKTPKLPRRKRQHSKAKKEGK